MKRRAPCVSAGFALVLLAVSLVSPAAAIEEADRLWLVGERAFADGLYPAARRALERFVAQYPKDARLPEAVLQAARTLADTKKAGEALALLADFPTKYPASPLVADARFWSGWIKSTGSDPRGGVADLRAFLAASPNHAQAANARRLIAQSLARYGDRDELLDAYKTLMEQTPPTADALYNAAQIAMRLARPRDQEAAWKRLSAEFPEHPLTRRMALDLASAAFKQKSWKSAVTYATQAAHSDDDAVKSRSE